MLWLNTVFSQTEMVCHVSDAEARYREHNADFIHLLLDIKFDVKLGKVIGKETITFKPKQPIIDSLFLDAPNIKINAISFDNTAIKIPYYTTKEGVVLLFRNKTLDWNSTYKVQIDYEAQPSKGLYFIGFKDSTNRSRKQIWTQGQGIDNRHWFPCFDDVADKAITETIITFDKDYTVISNGALVDKKENPDQTATWHYRMPYEHVPYLVMIAIDKFAYTDYTSKSGITSRQYYYADQPQVAAPTYQYSDSMMDWMENELNVPYAWKTYCNVPVQDFMFGAMENTSATIYGDFYQLDPRQIIERPYVATNAHELTHQWFGDLITEWSSTHHWLHESFATYYAKLFTRKVWGEDHYNWTKRGEAMGAMYADDKDNYPVAHSKGGSNRHYPKGSFVIGMLRYVVGDSVYRKTISNYLKKHSFKNVDTHDFWLSFFENSGENLDWFFEEWILKSGYPTYNVQYETKRKETIFYISQTNNFNDTSYLFKMPIVLEVHYEDGTKDSVRAWIQHLKDTVVIPKSTKSAIAYTLFDPGYEILKKLDFEKPYAEKVNQALLAKNMLDRYDALVALRKTSYDVKRSDLMKIYANEKYYVLKNEIISQLSSKLDKEESFFSAALQDKDFLVRREALQAIKGTVPIALKKSVENLLTDTSYVTIELALRKLVDNFPENAPEYFETTKNTIGIAKNVRIAWLELNYQATKKMEYLEELTDYAGESFEFRTRLKAMNSLEVLQEKSAAYYKNMVNALASANGRLANPAFNTLKEMISDKKEVSILEKELKNGNYIDWQIERVNSYLKNLKASKKFDN